MNRVSFTAKQMHDDIEQSLGSHAPHGTRAEKLDARLKSGGTVIWRAMKRHPFLAMAALALGGVAAASAVGAAELLLGAAVAVAAYKVLREGEPPLKAIEELEGEVRKGL
jgi:hypothetical protein